MTQQVTISNVTANTPVEIYYCDALSANCVFVASVSEFPYEFDVPDPYAETDFVIIMEDYVGCLNGYDILITPTPTPSVTATITPTTTITPTVTTTQTPTITPTVTPSDCLCYCLTYSTTPSGLYVRYRDCNTDIVTLVEISSLLTMNNGNGTYTACICVKQGSSYAIPVCVEYIDELPVEVTCDPYVWEQGGGCSVASNCFVVAPTPTPTMTPTMTQPSNVSPHYVGQGIHVDANSACLSTITILQYYTYVVEADLFPVIGATVYATNVNGTLYNPINGNNYYYKLMFNINYYAVQLNSLGQIVTFQMC